MSEVSRKPGTIAEVVEGQLCSGCGVCAYLSPREIRMTDVVDHGRRPLLASNPPRDPRSAEAFQACPGVGLEHDDASFSPDILPELRAAWGPVIELWEGAAADPDLRFAGSSGGAASALALFGLERAGMHGVLQIAARPDVPYLNHTVLSRSREELMRATGSRYAPASPCDGLERIEQAPAPCIFIGKPCDVAAAASAERFRPGLAEKLGLRVAIFCAGAPSTRGTLELFRRCGIAEPADVLSVRYRGMGWPGRARIKFRQEGTEQEQGLSYAESWGLLQRFRPWRCRVCADHTGEFADIAVGDPWHRPVAPNEPGRSLLLVRSERGRRLLHAARQAGYLDIEPADPAVLAASQPELLRTRAAIWGRIWTSSLAGAAVPRYRGLPTFRFWCTRLSLWQRAQSILGTLKRVRSRRLREPLRIESPAEASGPRDAKSGLDQAALVAGKRDPARAASARSGALRLSVVVLNRDREGTLRRVLRSLGRQDRPPEEVVVVDNGSCDGSVEMVRREFPEVRLIALDNNRGIRGRNVGFMAAQGDWIVSLDNDIELIDAGALGRIVGMLERTPRVGAVSLKICEEQTRQEYAPAHWWHPRARRIFQDQAFVTDRFNEAAVVFPAEPLRRLGGYFEPLFWGGEEWDLALALMDQGLDLWYFPEPVLHLAPRGNLNAQATPRHARLIRNRLWIAFRRLPLRDALVFSLPRLLIWGGRSVRYGYLGAYLTGVGAFFMRLPRILRDRRRISQRTRRRIREVRRGAPRSAPPGSGSNLPFDSGATDGRP